jgi:hypothetical protein
MGCDELPRAAGADKLGSLESYGQHVLRTAATRKCIIECIIDDRPKGSLHTLCYPTTCLSSSVPEVERYVARGSP